MPFRKIHIGTASTNPKYRRDSASVRVVKETIYAIVAENCMKSESLQPKEGTFNFDLADRFVALASKMFFLLPSLPDRHSQAPKWFFTDSLGNNVSREC
jgi:endo-1,4-beta-xylanase